MEGLLLVSSHRPTSQALPIGLISEDVRSSSLRPGIGKVFINLDISSQVMYKPGNLANLLIEIGKSKDTRFNENSLNVRNIDPRYAIIAGRRVFPACARFFRAGC